MAYTVEDIDSMRDSTRRIMQTRMLPNEIYMDGEIHFTTCEEIEARLNTYIMAGVSPDELERKAKEVDQEWSEICKKHAEKRKGMDR